MKEKTEDPDSGDALPKSEPAKLGPGEKHELLGEHEELKLLTESQEQRIADLNDLVKRIQADFENFRKNTEKEKSEMKTSVSASIIKKLLSSLDDIRHSIEEAKKHKKEEETIHGFEMAYLNLRNV